MAEYCLVQNMHSVSTAYVSRAADNYYGPITTAHSTAYMSSAADNYLVQYKPWTIYFELAKSTRRDSCGRYLDIVASLRQWKRAMNLAGHRLTCGFAGNASTVM